MILAVSLNSFLVGFSAASTSQVPKVRPRKVAGPSGPQHKAAVTMRSTWHNHSLVTSEGSTIQEKKKEEFGACVSKREMAAGMAGSRQSTDAPSQHWQLRNLSENKLLFLCSFGKHSDAFVSLSGRWCGPVHLWMTMTFLKLLAHPPAWSTRASLVAQMVKNPPANAGDTRDMGSIPGLGRSPGGGHSNPPVFLPEEFQGQRSLADYSSQCHKKSRTWLKRCST